jgi:hypothetical protein
LFDGCNFQGQRFEVCGDAATSVFNQRGFNDKTSSLKVGPNTKLTLWESDIGQARTLDFTTDNSCLATDADYNVRVFDNLTSSARTKVTSEKVTISGEIKDATNNEKLSNAALKASGISIKFHNKDNNISYDASVKDDSTYTVQLPIGNYIRDVVVPNREHSGAKVNVIFSRSSGAENLMNNVLLSPKVDGWRAVLTWGEVPKDLDTWVILPGGEKIFHNNKSSKDGKVTLDFDKTTGFGPETVTLKKINSGIYQFYVNNFSKEVQLSASKARVVLYRGSDMVGEFRIPVGSADNLWWHVFDINATTNSFTLVNQFSNVDIRTVN